MPLYFLAPYLVHSHQFNIKLGGNMIIVTGGAGMIGSNIIKALNEKGINDILVVDNLKMAKSLKTWLILILPITWIVMTSWLKSWLVMTLVQ